MLLILHRQENIGTFITKMQFRAYRFNLSNDVEHILDQKAHLDWLCAVLGRGGFLQGMLSRTDHKAVPPLSQSQASSRQHDIMILWVHTWVLHADRVRADGLLSPFFTSSSFFDWTVSDLSWSLASPHQLQQFYSPDHFWAIIVFVPHQNSATVVQCKVCSNLSHHSPVSIVHCCMSVLL